jgi:hypothetical protein
VYRSASLAAAAVALLAVNVVHAQQVEVVPRDTTLGPTDTTPWVPSDTVVNEVRHVVKRGDTLWDLARQYLKDPFRWPDVFRRNTAVVENPHWIYPGEILFMPSGAVRVEALRTAEEEGTVVSRVVTRSVPDTIEPVLATATIVAAPGDRTTFAQSQLGLPGGPTFSSMDRNARGGVRRGEMDAAPFVTAVRGPADVARIIGTADREGVAPNDIEHRFQLNDHAYLRFRDRRHATVGSEFLVLGTGPALMDTARVMVPTGIMRVMEPQIGDRPAKARLIRQFGEVLMDQVLIPYERITSVDERAILPVAAGTNGRVVWVQNDPVLPSLQHYVVLSVPRGRVQVGDRFTLIDQTRQGAADMRTPPEDAAVVQVVRVTPFGATAMIVAQRLPIVVEGMHARMTGRLR